MSIPIALELSGDLSCSISTVKQANHLPVELARDRERLYLALNRAMEFDFDLCRF